MPIYAYRCRDCGKEFTTLVMSGETPECEHCASVHLDQQRKYKSQKTGADIC